MMQQYLWSLPWGVRLLGPIVWLLGLVFLLMAALLGLGLAMALAYLSWSQSW